MTRLRIDADAGVLRRRLGPVPWFVLEELLLFSDGTGVADTSVRAIAGALSLNKDTVARAIRRLRAEGVVVAQLQTHDSGRFGGTRYQIDPGIGVQGEPVDEPFPPRPAPASSSEPIPPPRETVQLSLIEQARNGEADHFHRSARSPARQDDALAPGVRPGRAGRQRDSSGTSGTAAGPC